MHSMECIVSVWNFHSAHKKPPTSGGFVRVNYKDYNSSFT